MKELYIAPELELLCLAPDEKIASSRDFDSYLGGEDSGGVSGVIIDPDFDIDVGV